MVDQVMVRFGGDTGQFNSQMNNAARSVKDTTDSMRASVAQMNASLAQLSARMGDMAQSQQAVAQNTSGLLSYENWRFGLSLLGYAYTGTTATIKGMYTTANAVPEVMARTEQAAQAAARSFADYAKSMAYVKEYGPLVRIENQGMIASYGRLIEKIDDYFAQVKLIKSGITDAAGAAISAAGAMDRFAQVSKEAGFDNATRALEQYMRQLMKIPGMTHEVAAAIESGFGSIKNLSAPLQQALLDITQHMSSTKEEAQAMAQKLTAAFRDPASGGTALLTSLDSVTESLRRQFQAAQKNNEVQKMQGILVQAVAQQERNLMDSNLRKLQEKLETLAKMGPAGRLLMIPLQEEIRLALLAKEQFEKQAEALERAGAALRKMLPDAEQLRQSMNAIVQSVNPISTQMDAVNGRIKTLRDGLQGSTGDAAKLLRHFEDFRSKAYWDVNAWRVGYGSDTTTDSNGNKQKVTEDTVTTREDAERDLARRIAEFQKEAADRIGDAWYRLSDRARASITSVVYNYGAASPALRGMYRSARSGDEKSLADEIRNLSANPGRRSQEANNITSPVMSGASEKERVAAQQALDKELDTRRQIEQSVSGGTEVEKARAENIRQQVAGKRDDVAEQERIVRATQEELAATRDAQNQQRLKNQLVSEEASLVQKRRELKKSELQLELANASNPEETLAKKKQLYDYEQSLVARNSAQWNQIEAQKVQAQSEYDKHTSEMEKQAAEQSRNIALRELDEKRTILRQQVAEGRISHAQLLNADIVLENERTAIERAYWQKLKEIATEGTSEYKAIVSKMSQLDAEASARRQKTVSRDMQMIVRDYKQAFDQIGSTISSSLMGMLQGTEKFSGLARNVALRIVQYFLDAGIKMVTGWLAGEAAKTTATVSGEAARTGAVAAGNAARTGAEGAAEAASIATKIAGVIKNIVASAGQTFAGIMAFLSPIMGPAAAGPAGAGMAAVMSMTSLASADIGMWNVPHDQIAAIHKNELIMPAKESEALRNLLSSGGQPSSSGTVKQINNFSAMDGASMRRLFQQNDGAILKTLEKAARRGLGGRK